MIPVTIKPDGIQFRVYVQPRSAKNMVVGVHGDTLKIKLTAPPVQGAANDMCIKFLSKCLQVPRSSIVIIAGHAQRHKLVFIRTCPTAANSTEPTLLTEQLHLLIKSQKKSA